MLFLLNNMVGDIGDLLSGSSPTGLADWVQDLLTAAEIDAVA
jgi:hypothetical protein